MLVEALFSEMQQQRVASQVQSVYVTAFQIMDETIQDLLQPQQPDADSRQHRRRGELHTPPFCSLSNTHAGMPLGLPTVRSAGTPLPAVLVTVLADAATSHTWSVL